MMLYQIKHVLKGCIGSTTNIPSTSKMHLLTHHTLGYTLINLAFMWSNQCLGQTFQQIENVAQHLTLPECHAACYCCHWHFLLHQSWLCVHHVTKFSHLFHVTATFIHSEISLHLFSCNSSHNTSSSLTCIFLLGPAIFFTSKYLNPGQLSITLGTFQSHSEVTRGSNRHNVQICIAKCHYIYSSVIENMHNACRFHTQCDTE
jgi:hypothetical protein